MYIHSVHLRLMDLRIWRPELARRILTSLGLILAARTLPQSYTHCLQMLRRFVKWWSYIDYMVNLVYSLHIADASFYMYKWFTAGKSIDYEVLSFLLDKLGKLSATHFQSNESDISYLKAILPFEHSGPPKTSPGSHSQSVSGSIDRQHDRLLASEVSPLSQHCIVVATLSLLLCISNLCHCGTPILKAAVQGRLKSYIWQRCNYCAHDKWRRTKPQANK